MAKLDESARWGEPVWGEIDTAIRHYDKLVVICSQDSLQSVPVIREIERGMQKEDREHRNVLFPFTARSGCATLLSWHRHSCLCLFPFTARSGCATLLSSA